MNLKDNLHDSELLTRSHNFHYIQRSKLSGGESAHNRFKYITLYSLADTRGLMNSKIINSRCYEIEVSLQTHVPYDDFILCN